ncbi:MAG: hypothetical protein IKU34_10540 [Clostridia bacterium]|nr:hypothetical protein [Clostridia bacterium]
MNMLAPRGETGGYLVQFIPSSFYAFEQKLSMEKGLRGGIYVQDNSKNVCCCGGLTLAGFCSILNHARNDEEE